LLVALTQWSTAETNPLVQPQQNTLIILFGLRQYQIPKTQTKTCWSKQWDPHQGHVYFILGGLNPLNPTVSYLIHTFLSPLNYLCDQNFAENLLYSIYYMASVVLLIVYTFKSL